jgi:hypothetical protein
MQTQTEGNDSNTGTGSIPPSEPPKQVVFRSTNEQLVLAFNAGYMDKSHGQSNYVASDIEQFDSFFLRIEDVPENRKRIERIRNHSSNGISFREVPDMQRTEELPAIAVLEAMSIKEIKDLCGRRQVEVGEDASKEAMILALIKKQ